MWTLTNDNDAHNYQLINGMMGCRYSDEEKQEFLFQLFRTLAVGGTMMQYEDMAEPYFETAKGIYKDFLTVFRNPGSGKVDIANCV